jgi:ABC-2 type transport system ATP-binding protein
MLEIRDLRKSYGDRQVLGGVDLNVERGQVLGLLGANGAGKTTLISIVAGLRPADGGSVRVADIDALTDRHQVSRHLGLAPQELGIYPGLSVSDNLALFARLAGIRGKEVKKRVTEVAEALGLADRLKTDAGELSGGQKRRLHTGMALLHRPDLMFLDEPTVGADVESRAEILHIVRSMADNGAAVVYTTHYLAEMEQLQADIAVLHKGRIVTSGSLGSIMEQHGMATVTLRFSGTAPDLPGWQQDGSVLRRSVPDADPGRVTALALSALDKSVETLVGVEIARPSLETAYLAITGTPIKMEESNHVVAA